MAEEILFDVTHDEKSLCILLGSVMKKIDKVSDEATLFLKKYGLKEHVFPVCLVLREGLSNAVRHGHKSDPGKIIKFELKILNDELVMEIEDQGNGFNWKDKRGSIDNGENLGPILDHGRGLKIMDQYFCDIAYNEKGNRLILKKKLND